MTKLVLLCLKRTMKKEKKESKNTQCGQIEIEQISKKGVLTAMFFFTFFLSESDQNPTHSSSLRVCLSLSRSLFLITSNEGKNGTQKVSPKHLKKNKIQRHPLPPITQGMPNANWVLLLFEQVMGYFSSIFIS